MATTHLPNLDGVDAVDDPEVRFYAIVGACISLVAAVEHDLFDIYMEATDEPPERAAPVFYRYVRFAHKRDTADEAVRAALKDHPLRARWEALVIEVQHLAGENAARNLLGHNGVSNVYHFVSSGAGVDVYEGFEVNQNANLVLANLRPAKTETLGSLSMYARQLVSLRIKLTRFRGPLR